MNNPLKKVAQHAECVCNRSDGLFIPNRQVSMLIAALLMMFFVTFLSGYFFGKKHMVEQFIVKAEQDSFADQIYSSLCALSEYEPEELRAVAIQDQESVVENMYDAQVQDLEVSAMPVGPEGSLATMQEPHCQVVDEVPAVDAKSYYAQLIGYGTEVAAKKFAHRLAQKNISVNVKKRVSVTPKGKKRTWFQIVTPEFSDRELLDKLVDRITKEEKLMGVHIVTC